MKGKEREWNSFRIKLEETVSWPAVYMFKFIVPADNKKIAQIENLFNSREAEVTMRQSRNGNYVSITAKEMMMNPEKVIQRYKKAADVKGVISL